MQRTLANANLTFAQEMEVLGGEFRVYLGQDSDQWGTTMHWFFTVADELYRREGLTPKHWQFRPSPLGPGNDPDDRATYVVEHVGAAALEHFGEFLYRYARGTSAITDGTTRQAASLNQSTAQSEERNISMKHLNDIIADNNAKAEGEKGSRTTIRTNVTADERKRAAEIAEWAHFARKRLEARKAANGTD